MANTASNECDAKFTCDMEHASVVGPLYYFRPASRSAGPYKTQLRRSAIIDVADDGTLAGVELIDDMPPPPQCVAGAIFDGAAGEDLTAAYMAGRERGKAEAAAEIAKLRRRNHLMKNARNEHLFEKLVNAHEEIERLRDAADRFQKSATDAGDTGGRIDEGEI